MVRKTSGALLVVAILSLGGGDLHAATGNSVKVFGRTLVLKNEKIAKTQYLAEYIAESETFDDFTKMFAVWGALDGQDAKAQLQSKIQFVESRKGSDPLANYRMFQSKDKKSFGLDFLISDGAIMEHNVWLYRNVKGGVLGYQFVRRHYEGKSKKTAEEFIKECPVAGAQALTFLSSAKLPIPKGYVN